jgi:predicted HicB family RNase H-like nuclease
MPVNAGLELALLPHDLEGDGRVLTESTNNAPTQTANPNPQYQQILQVAQRLYQQQPDWVTFFREVLGIEGVARRTFPNFDDLAEFEHSTEYAEIQKMVVRLRENKAAADAESEPTRVITVRLPKSMHEYLRTEAHDLRTSMNKLCISKLLQVVEQDLIPAEKTAPPKRRTTPVPSPTPPQPQMSSQSHLSSQPTTLSSTPSHGGGESPFRSSY